MKILSPLSWCVCLLVANTSFVACSADDTPSGAAGSSGATLPGGAGPMSGGKGGRGGAEGPGGSAHGGTNASGGNGGSGAGGANSVSGGGNGGSLSNGGQPNGGHANGGQPNGGHANGGQANGGHANAGASGSAGAMAGSGAGGASGNGHGGSSGAGPTMSATQTIFNARCINCHDATKTGLPAYPSLPLTSDVAYDALVSHPADETCGGTRVVPFDSAHSYLFRKLSDAAPCSGVQMPHRPEVGPSTPLSATELETIRAWIDGGAHP